MFIWPMLLEKGDPFTSEDYLFQWKADGIRLILSSMNGEINAYTRHKTGCIKRFPELATLKFREDVVLDGELVCFDPETKKDSWELVMRRFQMTNDYKIATAMKSSPVIFLVFDVLYLGAPTMNMELNERKEVLKAVIPDSPYISTIPFVDTEGEIYFEQIKKFKLEGCVAKRKRSIYRPGERSSNRDWIKIIRYEYYDVMITGIKKQKFGYFCSFRTEEGLKPAGVIEFATKDQRRQIGWSEISKEDNFKKIFRRPVPAIIKSRGKTHNGFLRTPIIHHLD